MRKHNLLIFICASVLLISGCKSIKDHRAANKTSWLKRNGYLVEKSDTVIHYDTIKGYSIDTFVRFDTLNSVDTFTLNTPNGEVRTIIRWKEREIIQRALEHDTIIQWKEITKTMIEFKTVEKTPFWVWLVIIVMGVVMLGLIFRRADKRRVK